MRVDFGVGIAVVIPVVRGPPKGAFLHRGAADPCQQELERPTGFISPVGKIAMVCTSDPEHAQKVQTGAQAQGGGGAWNPNQGNQGQVEKDKRDNHNPTRKERTYPSGLAHRHQCGAGLAAPGCCAADGNLPGNPLKTH